ncbi:MAG: ribosome recycling factor [Bacteriovoracales bacterium]|nr:ribosome recycling factor [Bacteriovoracales bacterium]
MIEQIKNDLNESMDKIIKGLQNQMAKVRTGRASPSVLDKVSVDYYGAKTPIAQVGQMSTPEARLLQIQPFDKSIIGAIEKAIIDANLGLTPSNDGNLIRIPFPLLTEEKRKGIVKDIKKMGEESKIALRNFRREQNEILKKEEKGKNISEDDLKKFQKEVQEITDIFVKKVDEIINAKEKELLTI